MLICLHLVWHVCLRRRKSATPWKCVLLDTGNKLRHFYKWHLFCPRHTPDPVSITLRRGFLGDNFICIWEAHSSNLGWGLDRIIEAFRCSWYLPGVSFDHHHYYPSRMLDRAVCFSLQWNVIHQTFQWFPFLVFLLGWYCRIFWGNLSGCISFDGPSKLVTISSIYIFLNPSLLNRTAMVPSKRVVDKQSFKCINEGWAFL
jgi:hypothetical protein